MTREEALENLGKAVFWKDLNMTKGADPFKVGYLTEEHNTLFGVAIYTPNGGKCNINLTAERLFLDPREGFREPYERGERYIKPEVRTP